MFGKKKAPIGTVSPKQKHESVLTLERLVSDIAEGMGLLIGLEHQLKSHLKVIELLEEEIAKLAKEDPKNNHYSPQELHFIEECLTDINDVITRLHPAAYTDLGVLLKEVRALISLGYERQNLLIAMVNLINLLNKIEIFHQRYLDQMKEGNVFNPSLIKAEMKKDEKLLIPLLKQKFQEVKNALPETSQVINQGLQFLEAGTKLMSVFDALDIEEITAIDRILRRKIVEEEADIPTSHLHLDDASLGEGAFGIVDSATYKIPKKKNKFKVALKTLKLKDELLKDEYTELSNEVARMKVLESPFVVYCYGLSLRKHHVHIIFERMDISLYDYLYDEGKYLNAKQFEKLARDVSLGILQLHLLNLTHRNLSSKNIMFSPKRWSEPIKIMDYGCGLSKYSLHTKGPTVYTPPEVFISMDASHVHTGWTTKGDIYSLGLVFWEACQKGIYPHKEHMYNLGRMIGKEKRTPPTKLSATDDRWVKNLIANCLQSNPALRPNAKDVCETVFAYSKKRFREQMKQDLKDVKDTVKNTPNAYPVNTSSRKSFSAEYSPIMSAPAAVTVVGDKFRVAEGESHHPQVPPPSRAQVKSMRMENITRKTQNPPPGMNNFRAAPPAHRPQLPAVLEENAGQVYYNGDEEEDSNNDGEDEYDKDDFYETERDGDHKSEEASIASRGPDEQDVSQTREEGRLVELAIQSCTHPGKLSRQVKKLKEDVLEEDTMDFSNLFSKVRMKKKLGDYDCQVVGLLIRWHYSLLRVNLEYNNITSDGIADLATGMRSHPTLIQLYLGGNKKITEINRLVRKLKKNTTLEVLGLDDCSIDSDGARKIGQLLSSRSRLLELDLSNNKIGNQGMKYLAKGLENNNDLRALIIQDQKVSCKKGMKELRKVAKKIKLPLNRRLEN